MKYSYKKLIALLFVAVLCVSLMGSAYAVSPLVTRAKAFIAATMLASNLVIEPINAAFDSAYANGIDPLNLVPAIHETWTDYLDQSVIQVRPDVVTVDGVEYSQILLGPQAAQSLRVAGLDFTTAYNILSNQSESITYASGYAIVDGVPIYKIDNVYRSPYYILGVPGTYNIGDGTYTVYNYNNINNGGRITVDGVSSSKNTFPISRPVIGFIEKYSSSWRYYVAYLQANGSPANAAYRDNTDPVVDNTPFSFDYTSGIIDAPLAEDDWLVIQVPTEYSDPVSGNTYNINNIINNYPDLPQGREINIDPTLNPNFQNDIDLGNGIGDLINTILNLLDVLPDFKFEFNKNVEPQPEPEPAPVPDPEVIPEIDIIPDDPITPDTIANTDYDFLSKLLRWIQSTINNFRVATSNAFHNIQETLNDILDSFQNIGDIINDLPTAFETHLINTFKKALDVLKGLLAPIFLLLKNALGIWHYVVEWLALIAAPFAWIIGRFSSAGNGIMLPIYASIAGFIVIAVYKRFGR